jgi:3-dehydroquinate synthase
MTGAADLRTLTVELGDRSYPIIIGPGAIGDSANFTPWIRSRQLLIVTNETVAPLYLARLTQTLEPHYRIASVILPDGEEYKTLDVLTGIFDKLLEERFDRGCTLLALGGGVVGDMTGFAAACYQRGVDFVQVPTTLLSQVDSSVGGKTGVNHPLGKNMIGAFHQPRCVIADTDTLNTLPDRELSAGLAEVIKYGLINDPEFFTWLEDNMDALVARGPAALGYAIERSCRDKAEVVAADEKEAGQRALLNLGHTFGHAIENGMGYGQWLHGEAVGAGMCMAARFSVDLGLMPESDAQRAVDLVGRARLPVMPPRATDIDSARFLQLMSVDKKVQDGQLRLVLMQGIGKAFIASDFSLEALAQSLDRMIPS